MDISHLHFLRPWWLLAVIPAVGLTLGLYYYRAGENNWRTVCDPHLLPALTTSKRQGARRYPFVALVLVWCLAILALAGPTWSRLSQALYRSNDARVIAVDLSSALWATDLPPDRLTRMRFKLMDLLQRLPPGRTGLVAFSGEAYTVSPLTQDNNTLLSIVPALSPNVMPVSGVSMRAALERAGQLLKQGGANRGDIILLTANSPSSEDVATAQALANRGYTTSVLGIGTVEGAPIPDSQSGFLTNRNGQTYISKLYPARLQQLANAGGGRYVLFTAGNADVSRLARTALAQSFARNGEEYALTPLWRDEGRWLILAILPFAFWVFRRGLRERIET
jgi:Ca-activated chloride channel family protein